MCVGMPGCDWAYCKARDEKGLVSAERLMADGDGWRAMMKGQGRWAPWIAPVPAVCVGSSPTGTCVTSCTSAAPAQHHHSTTMAVGHGPVFPPELWAHIMQYCSSQTLKVLALVSRSCCEDARKRLFRRLYFSQGWKFALPQDGVRIRDLTVFQRSLSSSPGWRSAVKNVRLCWTNNGSPHSWREPDRFENEAEAHLNDLVRDTANLLAEATTLQSLHLSIPLLDSSVPFALTRLDSLTIPITDCLHNDPNFAAILRLFQIPTLKHVQLDHMLRLNVQIPEEYCQSETSNVTHLVFAECGPVHKEIAHLLRWPKELQTLEFQIGEADGLNRFAYDSGWVDMASIREALWPLEECLQHLTVVVLVPDRGDPLEENGFQSFAKLRRLNIPIDMFLGLSSGGPYEPGLPIHTRLPRCLEELILQLAEDFWWGDWDKMEPSEETNYLLSSLAGLAEHRDGWLPNLKEVRISRGEYEPARKRSEWIPLDSEQIRQFVDLFRSSGISISFC